LWDVSGQMDAQEEHLHVPCVKCVKCPEMGSACEYISVFNNNNINNLQTTPFWFGALDTLVTPLIDVKCSGLLRCLDLAGRSEIEKSNRKM